eukprot:snap_masked-scaffold_5-processed-gene-15.42-mRNA-1 protein AED:1.00 eAED:1.00 QI:0/-1/0/0/-1/1/1/0/154
MDRKYDPPCATRLVDSLLRGSYIGVCWGIYFPHPLHTATSFAQISNTELNTITFRHRVSNVGKSSLCFAAFIGTFSGLTCLAEKFTNLEPFHPINVFIGGSGTAALIYYGSLEQMKFHSSKSQDLKSISRYSLRPIFSIAAVGLSASCLHYILS